MAWVSFFTGISVGSILCIMLICLIVKLNAWMEAWFLKWKKASEPVIPSHNTAKPQEMDCPVLSLADRDFHLLPNKLEVCKPLLDKGCPVLNKCCSTCMKSQDPSGIQPELIH